MSLDPKHLPRPMRGAYVLAVVAGTVLTAGGVAYGVVRGVAHHVASEVVNERWDDKFKAQVIEIATVAAVTASREAVERSQREQLGPLAVRTTDLERLVNQHVPKDEALGQKLEAVVAQCCPVTPHVVYPPRWR